MKTQPAFVPLKISSRTWGRHEGLEIRLFKMENSNGAAMEISNYGATVVSVTVPDKQHQYANVVVGFPDLEGYLKDTCYIGSTIGRYANRIGGACFELDGRIHHLHANDGENTNHGGSAGFNYRVFDWAIVGDQLQLTLVSPDGAGGFPGELTLVVTYSWNDKNELLINYKATGTRATIANFTNHSYFNLSAFSSDVQEHRLSINSASVLRSRENYVPDGTIIPAGQNTFAGHLLGEKFTVKDKHARGLNLYYILDKQENKAALQHAATLSEEHSGRKLDVYTDYPGVFLYTGDYLHSIQPTHTGKPAKPFDGLCLECQHYPDSINHANFPQAILLPGEVYDQNILFKFGLL